MPYPSTQSRRVFLKTVAAATSGAVASRGWPQRGGDTELAVPAMKNGNVFLCINKEPRGSVSIEVEGWPGFHIGLLMPALILNGTRLLPEECETSSGKDMRRRTARYTFS